MYVRASIVRKVAQNCTFSSSARCVPSGLAGTSAVHGVQGCPGPFTEGFLGTVLSGTRARANPVAFFKQSGQNWPENCQELARELSRTGPRSD